MIKLEDITVQLGNFRAKFTVEINKNEWIGLIGKSGAGKSTFLNLIAGFVSPDTGALSVNNMDMSDYPASKRPVSSLFQENNLFPHLSVYQNIATVSYTHLTLPTNREV